MLNRLSSFVRIYFQLAFYRIKHLLGVKVAIPPSTPIQEFIGSPKSILFFGYMGLGDAVMFLPTMLAIRKLYPSAKVDIIGAVESAAIWILESQLKYYNSGFRSIYGLDVKQSSAETANMNRQLRENEYDICVVPYTAPVHYFQALISSIPIRAGHVIRSQRWYKPRPNFLFNLPSFVDQRIDEREPGRHFRIAESLGYKANGQLPIPQFRLEETTNTSSRAQASQNHELISVHLGVSAAMSWKKWDDQNYLQLLKTLAAEFPDAEFQFFGSENEAADIEQVSGPILEKSTMFIGLPMDVVASRLSRSTLFIGNDSGLGHLAVALGIPTLRVFGMSDHFGCEPYTGGHSTIYKELPCSPCMNLGLVKPGYNLYTCGERRCLSLISVDEVRTEAVQLLRQR